MIADQLVCVALTQTSWERVGTIQIIKAQKWQKNSNIKKKHEKKQKHLNAIAGYRGSPSDKTSRTNRYFEKGLLPLSCLSTSTSCVSSDEVLRPVKVIGLYFLQFAQLVQNASQQGSSAQLAGIEFCTSEIKSTQFIYSMSFNPFAFNLISALYQKICFYTHWHPAKHVYMYL